MAVDPITQFYKGVVLIGATSYPIRSGASSQMDENWNIPEIVGNYGQFHSADGFIVPVVQVSTVPRDKVGEVLGSTFLNYFLTRSGDASHTTTAITSGFTFWDGIDGDSLATARADSFTISGSQGELITLACSFCGEGAPTDLAGTAPSFTPYDSAKPLAFNAITFGGGLADRVERFSLTYSNHHTPDGSLTGSRYPQTQNPGMWTAALQLTMKASSKANIPADGTPIAFTITGGSTRAITFTVPNPLLNNRKSRNISAPHNKRTYNFTAKPATAQACPITISSTF